MKTLNLKKIKEEFIMLTIFHGQKFNEEIGRLQIDDEIKNNLSQLVGDFTKDLLELAEFDPHKHMNKNNNMEHDAHLQADPAIL